MEYTCGCWQPNGEGSWRRGGGVVLPDWNWWTKVRGPQRTFTQHGPPSLIKVTCRSVVHMLKWESIIQFSPSNDQRIRLPGAICFLGSSFLDDLPEKSQIFKWWRLVPFQVIRGSRPPHPHWGAGEEKKGASGVHVEAELTAGVQGQTGVPKQGDEAETFCPVWFPSGS